MLMASRCSTIPLQSAVQVAQVARLCRRHMWLPSFKKPWKLPGKRISWKQQKLSCRTSLNRDALGKVSWLVNGASSHVRNMVWPDFMVQRCSKDCHVTNSLCQSLQPALGQLAGAVVEYNWSKALASIRTSQWKAKTEGPLSSGDSWHTQATNIFAVFPLLFLLNLFPGHHQNNLHRFRKQ